MGKAKGDHTPEQPPLDDARWRPIEDAYQQRFEQTGDVRLAILDLMTALAQGRLHCMARSIQGERRVVAPSEWVDQIELLFWKGRARVISRQPSVRLVARRRTSVREQVRGWVFYIWQPVLDRIWPPPAGSGRVDHADDSDLKEPLRAIDRAKVVLRFLYPAKSMMPRSLKEATGKVEEECEKRNWQPPSEDRVQAAAEQFGYRPPRKRQ